jgi:hypothetical protein
MLTLGYSPLKKIDIIFGLLAPVASVVVFVVGSANYNTSNSGVEWIFVLALFDHGQRPPSRDRHAASVNAT